MTRSSGIAGIQLLFPLVEKFERDSGISDFITQIVRNAAIGINIAKVLPQALWQKPGGDREIFVVRPRQFAAVFLCFRKTRSAFRDSVFRRQLAPASRCGTRSGIVTGSGGHCQFGIAENERLPPAS